LLEAAARPVRHRLSPSKLGLAEKCVYWTNPAFDYDEPPPGRAARVGSLTHSFAEALANGNSAPTVHDGDIEEVADALAIARGPLAKWIADWRSVDVPKAAELGLRMNVETGTVRPYPRRGEPGYERPLLHELGGELDLVRNFGTHLEVIDLKTGDPKYFTESQLRGYALLASSYYGVREVRVSFLRALKTKLTQTEPVTIDADELDAEHGRVWQLLRTLPNSRPQPGEHCWACPARAACPTRTEYRNGVSEDDLERAGFFDDAMAF
jgi:hypothetical protein